MFGFYPTILAWANALLEYLQMHRSDFMIIRNVFNSFILYTLTYVTYEYV